MDDFEFPSAAGGVITYFKTRIELIYLHATPEGLTKVMCFWAIARLARAKISTPQDLILAMLNHMESDSINLGGVNSVVDTLTAKLEVP